MAIEIDKFITLDTRAFTPGAVSNPRDYALAAKGFGADILGIADETTTSWLFHERACSSRKITPIFGATIFPGSLTEPVQLYARDKEGLGTIQHLVHRSDSSDIENIRYFTEGVIAVVPGAFAEEALGIYDKKSLYVRVENFGDKLSQLRLLEDTKIASRLRVPIVASNTPWHAVNKPYDQLISWSTYCLGHNIPLDTPMLKNQRPSLFERNILAYDLFSKQSAERYQQYARLFHPEAVLKSPLQMQMRFGRGSEGLKNTLAIAEAVEIHKLPRPELPVYPTKEDQTPFQLLSDRCRQSMVKRFGEKITREYPERLERELSVIGALGLESHFLIMHDIELLLDSEGINHIGTGSATCSLVCYVLGMTDIDPVAHGLPFERFLDETTTKVPDVDRSIDGLQRAQAMAKVFDYIDSIGMFGYYIATFPRYDDGSLNILMKAFGYSDSEIKAAKKSIKKKKMIDPNIQELKTIADMFAARELYRPKRLSKHPTKIVVTNNEVDEFILYDREHQQMIAIDKKEGEQNVEGDFVVNYGLSLVRRLKERLGIDTIPSDDPHVFAMIDDKEGLGIPLVESPWFRAVLAQYRLKSDNIPLSKERLNTLLAISRPAGENFLESYIEAIKRHVPIQFSHPILEEILGETYGALVFQDQVIKLVRQIGGFTAEEGQEIRKLISKDRSEKEVRKFKEKFVIGAIHNGLTRELGSEIFEAITRFVGYGFLKGHSLSLLEGIVYKAAWLKTYYPHIFMEEVITLKRNHYFVNGHPQVYYREQERLRRERP